MIGIVIVTHCKLGDSLVEAAEFITATSHEGIEAVSINVKNDSDLHRESIAKAIKKVDRGSGILILTDMFGGTPSNLSLPLLEKGKLEIITGVNLPMVVKLANQSGKESFEELASRVKEQGQSQIAIASQLLGE